MKPKFILPILVLFLFFAVPAFSLLNVNGNTGELLAATEQFVSEEPKLVIGRSNSMPVFNAGEEGTLIIPVENLHNGEAKNINVSLVVSDVDKFPFELGKMSLQTSMSSIGGNSSGNAIFFKMKAAPTAESKIYPLGVKIDYSSQTGMSGSASDTIYVKIVNDNKIPLLKLMGIQLENDQLDSGESKTVELKIMNDGELTARNIEVKLAGFTANGLRLDQPLDTFYLKEFKGREFKFAPFKIYADPSMESGTYPLDLSMKYKDESNKDYSKEAKVFITVEGTGPEGQNKKATPKLIIDNYSYAGEYVRAGVVFPLQISFLNTSQGKDINNIKISLSFEENMFSPVNNSNSFFVDNIPAGSSVQRIIRLKPKVDAANKNYNITVDIEYEDSKGTKYTGKELIGIPVTQEIKLLASEIEMPTEAFAGAPLAISVDYYNTGRSLIRNLMIHTEGNFKVKDGNVYIGNLESGKSDYYDVTITPEQEGKITGKIIFDYDDDIGKHYKSEKSFDMQVMKQAAPPMINPAMDMEQNKDPVWKKPVLIGIGLFALGLLGWVIRRKRSRKIEDVSLDE
ncbi:MAG: hypothetical protein PHC92_06405 [Syntrophomonadaceae bacterium]|nr:hypothetical protein [Syntrophomonadaceae bacterium]MDD3022315.1 hypothetical protein [Syntrophomonadaceae bacterium]